VDLSPTGILCQTTLMTEIIINETSGRRIGVKKVKWHNLKIDMTPMVDLGFLLISFFVMAVELSKPVSAKLNMPKDGRRSTELKESAALTVLLTNSREIWYYHGFLQKALRSNTIFKSSYFCKSGIGQVIRNKQKILEKNPAMKEGRDELTVLIKANDNADYTAVVDVLDEIIINKVKRYALVKITTEEKQFLKQMQAQ
jgi:biopolymer transport protein ExbD